MSELTQRVCRRVAQGRGLITGYHRSHTRRERLRWAYCSLKARYYEWRMWRSLSRSERRAIGRAR